MNSYDIDPSAMWLIERKKSTSIAMCISLFVSICLYSVVFVDYKIAEEMLWIPSVKSSVFLADCCQ